MQGRVHPPPLQGALGGLVGLMTAGGWGGGVCLILGMEMGMGGNHVAQGKQEERSSTEKQEPGAQREKEAFHLNTGAVQSFFQSIPTSPIREKKKKFSAL